MASKICYTYTIMYINNLKKGIAAYARKMAKDSLTIGGSGNLSVRHGKKFYIKITGKSFEEMKSTDFIGLDIYNPSTRGLARMPSCEYILHAACYRERPDIKAVFHTHPFFSAIAFSNGISSRPVTMEFAAYISRSIEAIEFYSPGSRKLARAVGEVCRKHDCIIMKKHGIITLGKNMQDAYVKSLMIEREAKAWVMVKLLNTKRPHFSRKEVNMLIGSA
jgi:L-fuculose-phosphate aldolase